MMLCQMRDAPRFDMPRQALPQPLPRPPLVVQLLRAPGAEGVGRLPVELSSGLRGRVDEAYANAPVRGGECGGETGGTGADDGEVHRASPVSERPVPSWLRISSPGAAGTRQAR